MLNVPIESITIADIEKFLQSGVRENTFLEFKEQFPNKLEKVIASMANTFGGLILIGVAETAVGGGVVPIKGLVLAGGLRERVIEIGVNAIYPPLTPEVRVVEFKSDPTTTTPDRAVVVIRVAESVEGGHAVDQRTAIYIRANNVSDWMRKATVEEIEWFLQKRQKSLSEKSRIIQHAQHHAEQFLIRLRHRHQRSTSEPKGRFVVWTVPTFPRLPLASPKQLYEASKKYVIQDVGIAPGAFPFGVPHPVSEGIWWGHDEAPDYYYTEIHQQGLIYGELEFWWDKQMHERVFLAKSAARLLLGAGNFARNLYRHFGYFGLFDFHLKLVGVGNRYVYPTVGFAPQMMDDLTEVQTAVGAHWDESALFENAKSMLREIYWAYGWDVLQKRLDDDFNE